MSDNQSWNSSGSEEDVEPREEPGHHVGVADLSGVLSKVSVFYELVPIDLNAPIWWLTSRAVCTLVVEFSGFSTYVRSSRWCNIIHYEKHLPQRGGESPWKRHSQ